MRTFFGLSIYTTFCIWRRCRAFLILFRTFGPPISFIFLFSLEYRPNTRGKKNEIRTKRKVLVRTVKIPTAATNPKKETKSMYVCVLCICFHAQFASLYLYLAASHWIWQLISDGVSTKYIYMFYYSYLSGFSLPFPSHPPYFWPFFLFSRFYLLFLLITLAITNKNVIFFKSLFPCSLSLCCWCC